MSNVATKTHGKIKIFTNQVIGSGSSGRRVYMGEHDGFQCAVKEIPLRMKSKELDLKRVKSEIQIMRDLGYGSCANIMNYIDSEHVEEENMYFIAMPFCKYTLCDYVEQKLYLKWRNKTGSLEVIDALFQITTALTHLHDDRKQGIIHRDLKPKNILIKEDIVDGEVKKRTVILADFGLSKELIQDGNIYRESSTGNVGTAYWRAPENHLTEKSDVFTLGLIYHYCFYGKEVSRDKINRNLLIQYFKKQPFFTDFQFSQLLEAQELVSHMTHSVERERPTATTI